MMSLCIIIINNIIKGVIGAASLLFVINEAKNTVIKHENEDAVFGKTNIDVIDGQIQHLFNLKNPPKKMLYDHSKSYIFTKYYNTSFHAKYLYHVNNGSIEFRDHKILRQVQAQISDMFDNEVSTKIYEQYCSYTNSIPDEEWEKVSPEKKNNELKKIIIRHWKEEWINPVAIMDQAAGEGGE